MKRMALYLLAAAIATIAGWDFARNVQTVKERTQRNEALQQEVAQLQQELAETKKLVPPEAPAKDDKEKMNEPENPCHQAFAELTLGMTADELDALYKKYACEGGSHPIMARTEKRAWTGRYGNGQEKGEAWETHWQECGELMPFPGGPPIWMADLKVHLWDGKVVDATYKPTQVRVEEKDEHWK